MPNHFTPSRLRLGMGGFRDDEIKLGLETIQEYVAGAIAKRIHCEGNTANAGEVTHDFRSGPAYEDDL